MGIRAKARPARAQGRRRARPRLEAEPPFEPTQYPDGHRQPEIDAGEPMRRCNNRPYGRQGRRRHASQDKPKRTESVDGPRTLSGTVTGSAAPAAAKDALCASTSNPLRPRQTCPPRNACPWRRGGDERCLARHTSSVSGYPQRARSLTLRWQNAPYHISAPSECAALRAKQPQLGSPLCGSLSCLADLPQRRRMNALGASYCTDISVRHIQ